MTGDFDGTPFYTGSLHGLRAFAVCRDGTLAGIVHKHLYTEGENQAMCILEAEYLARRGLAYRDHKVARLGCTCGFYAFHDGSNELFHSGFAVHQCEGIIEGYGRCTVGDRGFRAEKCRVVALVLPLALTKRQARKAKVLHTVYRFMPLVCGVAGLAMSLGISVILGVFGSDSPWLAPALIWTGALLLLLVSYSVRIETAARMKAKPMDHLAPLIQAKYPNVPVYQTTAEMLRKHPLTNRKEWE